MFMIIAWIKTCNANAQELSVFIFLHILGKGLDTLRDQKFCVREFNQV